ncbi:MAG: hypothetical protein HRT35_00840 [Algicola sp.]|nr:hypothetical protein [Algicola sp.]
MKIKIGVMQHELDEMKLSKLDFESAIRTALDEADQVMPEFTIELNVETDTYTDT